ncbi:MAG: hypothetical protein V2G41_09305 [bacterium JZ-2024 1]
MNIVQAAKTTLFVLIAKYLQSGVRDGSAGNSLIVEGGEYIFTHQSKYVFSSGSPPNVLKLIVTGFIDRAMPVEGVTILFPVEVPQKIFRRSVTELLMDVHVVIGVSNERGIQTFEQALEIAQLVEARIQEALSEGSTPIYDYPAVSLGSPPSPTGRRASWFPFIRPRRESFLRLDEPIVHRLLSYRVFVEDD